MKTMTTINQLAKDYKTFHPYITIPYKKTSMTIPAILFLAISTKRCDARKYFSDTATQVKDSILSSGIPASKLVGKLSTKVQEIAWCEIINDLDEKDIDRTDFAKAQLIPYEDTSMTVPKFLFNLILSKHNGNKTKTNKYIKEQATILKNKIKKESGLSDAELKGKVSHKIQESLWLEFIPESVLKTPVELVA
jgi:hypothetical protein